jgi:tetrahydromethanopterin S-methyltransferase subunit B
MSNYVTDKQLTAALSAQTEEIVDVLQTFMHQVDERFNKLEARVDDLDKKFDRLLNTIDGFLKRLDEVEAEQTARDVQFERLLEWAREVSKKTGVPLKNL